MFAPIVDPKQKDMVYAAPVTLLAKYESGKYANRQSYSIICNDAIVFSLAQLAFKDSPRECHFIPKKGSTSKVDMRPILRARDSSWALTLPAKNATWLEISSTRCSMKGGQVTEIGTSIALSSTSN